LMSWRPIFKWRIAHDRWGAYVRGAYLNLWNTSAHVKRLSHVSLGATCDV